MREFLNPVLMDVAAWRLQTEKKAFVPAGGDPSQGGGAPPPGGDPSMGGGMTPPPGAGAGPPPGMDPMSMSGPGGMPLGQPGMATPGQTGAPGAGGKVKVDPTLIYMELGRIRKLITHMMKSTGIDMPPDILDDSTVAQAVGGAQPNSQPIGQDASSQQEPPSLPAMGGQGAINPMEAPGGEKQSSVASLFQGPVASDLGTFSRRMDALAALSRSLGRG